MKLVGLVVRVLVMAWIGGIAMAMPAYGELVVSDLVVELRSGKDSRKDIELLNNSDERSYVEVTPAEIMDPGRATELRRPEPDPELLGLLVSPNRMILEPGQHKVIRIAAIAAASDRERIYRVTLKPVVGEVSGEHSGLKVLVGYDVLVILRPINPTPMINGAREGRSLTIRNEGNSSAELIDGKQCQREGKNCAELPAKRLYAGAEWRLQLEGDGPVEYSVKVGDNVSPIRF